MIDQFFRLASRMKNHSSSTRISQECQGYRTESVPEEAGTLHIGSAVLYGVRIEYITADGVDRLATIPYYRCVLGLGHQSGARRIL